MNKITIIDKQVTLEKSDGALEVILSDQLDVFDVLKIKIMVHHNTTLTIDCQNKEDKIDLTIVVFENVELKVWELRGTHKLKVQNQYIIKENSHVTVQKFYDVSQVKELDLIHLNGPYASIMYQLSTIASSEQKYNMVVYHNASNTESIILHNGVSVEEGSLDFHVTSVVYEGLKGCLVDQKNRIITYNDHKCTIEPILLIEENDITANHSAYVGQFKKEDLFYLLTRGIPLNQANQLLVKGFLLNQMPEQEKLMAMIEKYWR